MSQPSPAGREPDVGRATFDEFLAGLDYPVFVVTAASGAERAGCLVGFATQTSIEPPRLLVCLSEENHTTVVAARAQVLAVHVLDDREHPLAERFGGETGDEVDKFAGLAWRSGPDGVPLLEDCPRRLVGRIVARVPLGDHVGHLLAPLRVEAEATSPLTYQDATDIEAGHPA
jgi:flavin reductase (DIM6/NTAB) family NADH-FMN oxidoreductase RutF